ncbi:MAG: hypothetical protein M3R24_28040 [Chloroflexota bacterium]|nr:hypothetical protein [Chloroflexota bacterium]
MDPNQMTANEVVWIVGIMTVIGGVMGTVAGFLLSWGSAALSAQITKKRILGALEFEIDHNFEIARVLRNDPVTVVSNTGEVPEFPRYVWESQQTALPQLLKTESFERVYRFYLSLSKCSTYGPILTSFGTENKYHAHVPPELNELLDRLLSDGKPL